MRYTSKKRELRLIMRPTDRTIDEHRRVQIHPGKKAEFIDGKFNTDDPELIEFLHNHPLRGSKFDEITEYDEKILASLRKPNPIIPIATGAVSTANAVLPAGYKAAVSETPETSRPEDKVMVSPELVRMIDERIQTALGTIIDLLKPEAAKDAKAEKIMAGKPTKIFTCKVCGEVFPSGVAVGKHKKEKHAA